MGDLKRPTEALLPTEPFKDGAGSIPSGFILKLYQMVNGAPDDVISWVPSGAAFRIGSDLNRLETETLPQYFRHSRFQSLVRQLNFYNFRKVNRERTFWIYKHHLFHRDRPQDLHLLRRRTCPGVDGRKNRFASSSRSTSEAGKNAVMNTKEDEGYDDNRGFDDLASEEGSSRGGEIGSSDDENSRTDEDVFAKKCRPRQVRKPIEGPKRVKEVLEKISVTADPKSDMKVVDMSLLETSDTSELETAIDDESNASFGKRSTRSENAEQQLVVSQVASMLEMHAKKARKVQRRLNSNRLRRTNGAVTPPYYAENGSDGKFAPSNGMVYSHGLITYDDEISVELRDEHGQVAIVTDGDESMSSKEDDRISRKSRKSVFKGENIHSAVSVTPTETKYSEDEAAISEHPEEVAKMSPGVTAKILAKSNDVKKDSLVAVVGFCMTTSPNKDDQLCRKVLQLMSSCDSLAIDYHRYREALYPPESPGDTVPSYSFASALDSHHAVPLQQILDRKGSQQVAVREFKTFAINIMEHLSRQESLLELSDSEMGALKFTVELWCGSLR